MKKIIRYVLALVIIFSMNFLIPRIMPGDPVTNLLGEDFIITAESLETLRAELGLDKPLLVQYGYYWSSLLRLDLGESFHLHSPVAREIAHRMPWTLLLMGLAILLGTAAGTLLGALAGWGKDNAARRTATALFLGIYSTPPFFLSLFLLYVFGFKAAFFPLKGFYETGTLGDIARHFFLPVVVLSLFLTARNYLIMRGSVLQEKGKPYVLYAWAKGLRRHQVLFRHVFRNASLPIITLVALDFGFILSGALFVEIVFSMNGMGTLIFDALQSRDYPLLQGCFLVITLMVILANAGADILYRMIDPRIQERM